MLLECKAVAERAGLDPAKFDLKTLRSTYATRMLRSGFDVRTVQHWMGHKSLETTMRYLVPAVDVHDRLDQIKVPGSTTLPIPKKNMFNVRQGSGSRPALTSGPENPACQIAPRPEIPEETGSSQAGPRGFKSRLPLDVFNPLR
jgi:hypothetical protein